MAAWSAVAYLGGAVLLGARLLAPGGEKKA
jgi:putative membrane protein